MQASGLVRAMCRAAAAHRAAAVCSSRRCSRAFSWEADSRFPRAYVSPAVLTAFQAFAIVLSTFGGCQMAGPGCTMLYRAASRCAPPGPNIFLHAPPPPLATVAAGQQMRQAEVWASWLCWHCANATLGCILSCCRLQASAVEEVPAAA